jgi:uncharacterized protein
MEQDTWFLQAEAICAACGGHCCIGACPPLCTERIETILSHGDYRDRMEDGGYRRIRTKENGECSMLEHGKCQIHAFKPETCLAGPFTFDVTDTRLAIYLKHESICPLVTHLKASREMYDRQYQRAVGQITHLVARLPDDELQVISSIPEDETDLVVTLGRPRAIHHDRH